MEDIKLIERRSFDRQEALREAEKAGSKPKEGKSTFDELLEQSRKLGQGLAESKTQTKTATKEAAGEAEKLRERQKERSKDSEKEEEKKQDSSGEKRETADGGKKVVGKANLKQHQGGSRGGEGDGSFGKKGERSNLSLKKSGSLRTVDVGSHNFAKEFQAKLTQNNSKIPGTIPQQVLNQIVKTVRLGVTRTGDKVLELSAGTTLFQGLTLRFQSRNGKVAVTFLTANPETRSLFKKEAARIRETLIQKGVAVETVDVV